MGFVKVEPRRPRRWVASFCEWQTEATDGSTYAFAPGDSGGPASSSSPRPAQPATSPTAGGGLRGGDPRHGGADGEPAAVPKRHYAPVEGIRVPGGRGHRR